jgi:hypothetical protein
MPSFGRPRDQHKEQFWRQTLQRFAQSRLSATQFCRLHQLPLHTFWAWKRTLRLRDSASRPAPQRSPAPAPQAAPFGQLPLFVPLRLPLDQTHPGPGTQQELVEVLLPNGVRLRLSPQFDTEALQRLLTVLRGVSC